MVDERCEPGELTGVPAPVPGRTVESLTAYSLPAG
jgi:hypothetical protein